MQWGLIGNPFERKIAYDVSDIKDLPFLPLRCHRIIYSKLKFNISSPFPIYQILLGERGIGKTSSLLFFHDFLRREKAQSFYSNFIGDPFSHFYHLLGGKESEPSFTEFKRLTSGKGRFFFLIDFPDKFKTRKLELFLERLENFLKFKNISLLIAMNKSHYDRSFNYSEIFGKFSTITIDRFTDEMTKELIRERLKAFREKDASVPDELYPFSEDIVKVINSLARGIPRNILSACEYLLMEAEFRGLNKIDVDFAREVLSSEDFARKIIFERVEDETYREILETLYKFIKNKFKGYVKGEENLIKTAHEEFGWSRITIKKRINDLEKLGLIKKRKSPLNLWTNEIIVTPEVS